MKPTPPTISNLRRQRHPRRHVRPRLPGRGPLPRLLRPSQRRPPRHPDRPPPALRHRGLACAAELAKRGYPSWSTNAATSPAASSPAASPLQAAVQAPPRRDRADQTRRRAPLRHHASEPDHPGSTPPASTTPSSSASAWATTCPPSPRRTWLPGVWESLQFIEPSSSGPQAACTSDARRVIGGGNTAIDVAREAVMLHNTEATAATPPSTSPARPP
jgi:hypothetical protein